MHALASLTACASLEKCCCLFAHFAWSIDIFAKRLAREGFCFVPHSLASLAAGVSFERCGTFSERFAWNVCIHSKRFAREGCMLFRSALAGLAGHWRVAREGCHFFRAFRLVRLRIFEAIRSVTCIFSLCTRWHLWPLALRSRRVQHFWPFRLDCLRIFDSVRSKMVSCVSRCTPWPRWQRSLRSRNVLNFWSVSAGLCACFRSVSLESGAFFCFALAGLAGRGRFARDGCHLFRKFRYDCSHFCEAFRSRWVPLVSLCARWPRWPRAFHATRVPSFSFVSPERFACFRSVSFESGAMFFALH